MDLNQGLLLAGVALVVTGLTVLFGAWALVGSGVVLILAGVDWERES